MNEWALCQREFYHCNCKQQHSESTGRNSGSRGMRISRPGTDLLVSLVQYLLSLRAAIQMSPRWGQSANRAIWQDTASRIWPPLFFSPHPNRTVYIWNGGISSVLISGGDRREGWTSGTLPMNLSRFHQPKKLSVSETVTVYSRLNTTRFHYQKWDTLYCCLCCTDGTQTHMRVQYISIKQDSLCHSLCWEYQLRLRVSALLKYQGFKK